MSLSSYFYERCPKCGSAVEEDVSPITGVNRVACTKCKTVIA